MRLADQEPQPPSKGAFARLVMEGIRRVGETRELVYDEEQFRIHPESEAWPLMNLSNLYDEYLAAEGPIREKVLKVAVRNWFADRKELPETFEDVNPDLLPSVRSRSYSEFTRLQLAIAGSEDAHWPRHVVGDHLAVSLVYDLPDSMRHIQQRDLDEWGVTYYEALEAARENLAQMPAQVFANPDQGVYISASGDNYDASRLILLDLIHKFEVRGDPVAMVPNRDTLLVTGTEDDTGLAAVIAIAEKTLEQPRPISGFAFRLVDDEWTCWLPPANHVHFEQFHKLYVQSLGQEYAEQKALLDELHEKRNQKLSVASYNLMQEKSSGHVSSYCLWIEGVETLIPRSERIIFVRPDGSEQGGQIAAYANWNRVFDAAGDLFELTDHYPERFHARGFPSSAVLESLGKQM